VQIKFLNKKHNCGQQALPVPGKPNERKLQQVVLATEEKNGFPQTTV
jgi:hypothetical protein